MSREQKPRSAAETWRWLESQCNEADTGGEEPPPDRAREGRPAPRGPAIEAAIEVLPPHLAKPVLEHYGVRLGRAGQRFGKL